MAYTSGSGAGGSYKTSKSTAQNNYWDKYAQTHSVKANSTLATQKQLKAAGYDPGPLDGVWGKRTQAAYDAYNSRNSGKNKGYQQAGLTDPRAYQPAPAPKPATPTVPKTVSYSAPAPTPTPATPTPKTPEKKETYPDEGGIKYKTPKEPEPEPEEEYNQYYDPEYYMNLIKDQFRYDSTADINAIRQAYEKGRSELQGQVPGVEQNAREASDANDAYYYAQALPELRAAMEQAGLYRGGDMLGGNVDLLTMRGQNMGQIGQDKTNQLNAISQAVAQLNAEEPLKVAEVEAANNSAEAQALLQAANTGVQNQMSLANLTGNILGTDTLAKISQAYNQAMGIADRTGVMPNGEKTLTAQQQEADNTYRQAAFEESIRQFNANYGLDLRRMTLQEVQQKLDEKYRNGQLSLQARAQALNEAQQLYNQNQDTWERSKTKSNDYNTYMQTAIQMMNEGTYDATTGKTIKKNNSNDVLAYIASLPISAQQKAEMANALGL